MNQPVTLHVMAFVMTSCLKFESQVHDSTSCQVQPTAKVSMHCQGLDTVNRMVWEVATLGVYKAISAIVEHHAMPLLTSCPWSPQALGKAQLIYTGRKQQHCIERAYAKYTN